jgi:hypothetical protein
MGHPLGRKNSRPHHDIRNLFHATNGPRLYHVKGARGNDLRAIVHQTAGWSQNATTLHCSRICWDVEGAVVGVRLENGGVDVFYVDESMDASVFTISSLAIPFLRLVDGTWTFVWEDQFKNIRDWRRRISKSHGLPVRKELKGQKLASGRGRYHLGKHQFTRRQAAKIYRDLLSDTDFLPDNSVITVVGTRSSNLYGHSRLEALVVALLQRLRRACVANQRTGLIFFDEGHGEYRKLYRKAKAYLPTGSDRGGWADGKLSKNLPLDNFTKDANIKESEHSFFIQLADLVSYAAFLKVKGETESLSEWQAALDLGRLYQTVPVRVLNTSASRADPLGIVRL